MGPGPGEVGWGTLPRGLRRMAAEAGAAARAPMVGGRNWGWSCMLRADGGRREPGLEPPVGLLWRADGAGVSPSGGSLERAPREGAETRQARRVAVWKTTLRGNSEQ